MTADDRWGEEDESGQMRRKVYRRGKRSSTKVFAVLMIVFGSKNESCYG